MTTLVWHRAVVGKKLKILDRFTQEQGLPIFPPSGQQSSDTVAARFLVRAFGDRQEGAKFATARTGESRCSGPTLDGPKLSSPSSPLPKLAGFSTRAVFSVLAFAMIGGCAGYQFGPSSLFRPDIRTIHVPMIRNETFRHDVGPRLTEAVVRELQERTPYVVTGDPSADSVLTCRVVSEFKRSLTETATDEVRALDMVVNVEASWISRNGQVLMENRILPTGNLALLFSQDTRIVPEAGQSIEVELQNVINSLAERIVSQMEMRW